MKLRIRDNSIRLRLTQVEVSALRDDGLVSARTAFPGGREFQYVLESSPASVNPGAFLSDAVITVRLPDTAVLAWATSDQVSIQGEQLLSDGEMNQGALPSNMPVKAASTVITRVSGLIAVIVRATRLLLVSRRINR